VPTRLPRRSNRGQDGAFASPLTLPWYKSGRGAKPQVPKPPTPLGFSFLSSPVCVPREEGRRGAAATLCRGGARRASRHHRRAAAGDRHGHEGPDQSPRGRKEPFASGKEPGRGQGTIVNAYATGNAYSAPPSTLSRPRLHRRPDVSAASILFTSSPPWLLCGVEPAALGCAAM
jgi:hypothetical protein